MTSTHALVYSIDANDRLVFVNDAWTACAAFNDGYELTPDAILGRSLWDLVPEPTASGVYQAIVARVRQRRRAARGGRDHESAGKAVACGP